MWTPWLRSRFGSNRRTSETRLGGCRGGETESGWDVHELPVRVSKSYNPATGKFDFSNKFSQLSRYWLDPGTKTIPTFNRSGMAGLVFVADKLSVHLRTGRKMSGFQLLGGLRRSCNKMLFAFPPRTAQVQIPLAGGWPSSARNPSVIISSAHPFPSEPQPHIVLPLQGS